MSSAKLPVWAAVCAFACHDVTERGAAEGILGAVGGAAGSAEGHHVPEAGAGGAEVDAGGTRSALPADAPAAADVGGAFSAGAGGAGGAAGEGGEPLAPSDGCFPGAECQPADDCWLGAVQCEDGVSRCVRDRPAPPRSSCTFGECTGDGGCVKHVPSCVDEATSGCGIVTIPGGSFRLGFRTNETEDIPGEPVTVSSFAIDTYEVSVARFRKFWAARSTLVRDVTYDGVHLGVDSAPDEPLTTEEHNSYNWTPEPRDRETHPINRLSWQTAFLFCAWDGGRLPTEAEWEYVATGREVDDLVSGRDYPWGDMAPNCSLANDLSCGSQRTVPVDSFAAWGGIYQMAGNVTEWVADSFTYRPGPCWDGSPRQDPICVQAGSPYFVAKGGSFSGTSDDFLGVFRLKSQAATNGRGVRCARDLIGNRTSP